jgi:hypothetical protein
MDMPQKPAAFSGFTDPYNHGDGTVSFQINREDGKSLSVSCPIAHLALIINYFLQLARLATEEEATEWEPGALVSLVPIDTDGLAIAPHSDPDKTLIIARLGNFHLAYAAPNTKLAELETTGRPS